MVLELGTLNVVTGPNGSGKSNLYRALRLLAESADGQLIPSLAREGGLSSTLWAGPETITREMATGEIPIQGTTRRKPISLRLGITGEPFSYSIELGLPQPSNSMFSRDPEVKRECLWRGAGMEQRSMCADHRRGSLRCRGEKGSWKEIELPMTSHASMLAEYADPFAAPELILMRDVIRSWRFYDTFRTDAGSPARRPAVGTFTPVMSGDGCDLAAALQTIREIGDSDAMHRAIKDAFPGSRVVITNSEMGMQLSLEQPGMLRVLTAAELSDGTLRYLLLVAALLSPRAPELLVINEPENSLHPDLIPALGRLIRAAAERSQILVVTHSQLLLDQLEADEICVPLKLQKEMGETVLENSNLLHQYGWKWPAR